MIVIILILLLDGYDEDSNSDMEDVSDIINNGVIHNPRTELPLALLDKIHPAGIATGFLLLPAMLQIEGFQENGLLLP